MEASQLPIRQKCQRGPDHPFSIFKVVRVAVAIRATGKPWKGSSVFVVARACKQSTTHCGRTESLPAMKRRIPPNALLCAAGTVAQFL
jgi:hypothetical protein